MFEDGLSSCSGPTRKLPLSTFPWLYNITNLLKCVNKSQQHVVHSFNSSDMYVYGSLDKEVRTLNPTAADE